MSRDLFDRPAALADAEARPDRLDGVRTKARAITRRRRLGVATAVAAAVVLGGVGVLQLQDRGDRVTEVPVATGSPAPTDTSPQVEIGVTPLDATHFRVAYTVRGTAHAFVPGRGDAGPLLPGTLGLDDSALVGGTRVYVDGTEQIGSDGGDIKCVAGTPTVAFDARWGDSSDRAEHLILEVARAGTYDVRVEATYCGAGGKIETAAAAVQVTTQEQSATVTAEIKSDVDGDGRPDQVRTTEVANEGTGESDNNAVVVTTATANTISVSTGPGFSLTGLQAVQLDDGGMEIVAVPDGGDRVPTFVATFVKGRGLVLVKPVAGSLESAPVPYLRVTGVVDGELLTIRTTAKLDDLDPAGDNSVEVSRWSLWTEALGLRPEGIAGQCIAGTDWRTVHPCE
ncbi:MAG: hypothetical protein V9G04_05220 [Nocardioides sp.]|jgi:hypothetical protein